MARRKNPLLKVSQQMMMMKKKKKKKPVRSDPSARAGLVFSVTRAQHLFPCTLKWEAAVLVTGVVEYLVTEILDLASDNAALRQSKTIVTRDIPGLTDKAVYRRLKRLTERSVVAE